MKSSILACSSLAVLVLAPARAQQTDVERIIALARSESRVMDHLDHLTNRIGPRLTGSKGYEKACEWARARFESFGLKDARLEKWGEFPVGFERGASEGRMIAPDAQVLHFGANAWTAGTNGPTRGSAVLAPTNDEELARVSAKLPGAWVVTSTTPVAAPRRPDSGDTSAPASPSGDRAFRDRLEKAYDEAGIAGTLRAGRNDLILTGGNHRIAFDKLPKRPALTLLAAEHRQVVDHLKAGREVVLVFDVRHEFVKGPIALSNVIAEIRGTEKPDEVVIVSGHLDSWDGATGATDNGTGVATTLEAARLLAKAGVRPKRTIRFVLWGGEEQGLLGSRAYIEAHKAEMDKVSAVLVHDGGTNYCAGITATPPMVKDFEAIFVPVKDLDPTLPFKVREVKGLSAGSSDHDSFLRAGVPGFFWSQSGRANYNHTHHTQFDTYDQAIPDYQVNSSIVIAVGALGIANLPALLSRENLVAPSSGRGGGRRLGVQLADDMTIEEVVDGGLASKSGFAVGDRIVRIGDKSVADSTEMRAALTEGPAKTNVVVLRKGREVTLAIEFPPDTSSGAGLTRRIGVRFGDGLTVDVVTPGGVADQAGIRAGDTIVRVGDKRVSTLAEYGEALGSTRGETKLGLRRDGQEIEVTLPATERP